MLDNEQVEQDVESGESSSPEPSPKSDQQDSEVVKSAPESKELPFHEHPRFKELVEQKNQFAEANKQYERRLKDMQDKIESFTKSKAEPSAQQKLVERLKGIDPEFGTFAEQQAAAMQELSEIKQWRAQAQQEQYLNSARAAAEKVQSELKVDKDLHALYMSNIPMGTPIDQVAAMYKSHHAKLEALMSARERSALSKYTESKKIDSKVPAQTKGRTAKPASKDAPKYSKNSEEAREQIVSSVMKNLRDN